MIVLPIIRNLGDLKKFRLKRPIKIGRNDPGLTRPRLKQPRAETTKSQNDWAETTRNIAQCYITIVSDL